MFKLPVKPGYPRPHWNHYHGIQVSTISMQLSVMCSINKHCSETWLSCLYPETLQVQGLIKVTKWALNPFSVPRWNWTGSIGCMTSWPRSVWRRPHTSMLVRCSWDTRSHWAVTSSSPPPSGLRHWEISWYGFSLMWTQVVGTSEHDKIFPVFVPHWGTLNITAAQWLKSTRSI